VKDHKEQIYLHHKVMMVEILVLPLAGLVEEELVK
jgi:hypothetical protein